MMRLGVHQDSSWIMDNYTDFNEVRNWQQVSNPACSQEPQFFVTAELTNIVLLLVPGLTSCLNVEEFCFDI